MNAPQRRLARHLTRLRQEAGYTPAQVADLLGWSRPKVSRVECGKSVPKDTDLQALLNLCRCDPGQATALTDLAQQARTRGWWTTFNDVLTNSYVALEDGASSIRVWEAQLIPDLLQTEAYARAAITATHPHALGSVHRQVQARMARRSVLNRDYPPTFHAVIDEAALRRPIGGPEVMEPQYVRLLTLARQPHIMLQLLPFAAGPHPGLAGSFALLGFDDPADPDAAFTKGQSGEIEIEAAEQTANTTLMWDRIVASAASPDDTRSMIANLTEA